MQIIQMPYYVCVIVKLSGDITEKAAELSHQKNLGTADAMIYATVLASDANLITLDDDFRGLPKVTVLEEE